MLRISTKGRYGLRLMMDLALHANETHVPLKDVAARQNITVRYLEAVISPLMKANLVMSVRGKGGGYRLTRPADQYNVFEILACSEGDLVPVSCLVAKENMCPRAHDCSTLPIWEGFYRLTKDYFEGINLAQIVSGVETLTGCEFIAKEVSK